MSRFPHPSPADLVMRTVEELAEHPDANATVGVVLHLTGAVPDPAGLREHVAGRLTGLPCLTHLLSGDGPTARWVPAAPDLARHIGERRVGSEPEDLEAAVRVLLREPLPERAPAWRMVLLHGHAPDGFALLYLTHHAVQDGGSMAAVMEALFGDPLVSGQPSAAVARDVSRAPRPRLRHLPRSAARLLPQMRGHKLWQSPSRPLSSRRDTLWTRLPSARLRTAARAGDASTNDVCLAALAHAVAGWAETAWPRAAKVPLPVMIPVNLRTPKEATAPGNRLFLTRVDLPGGAMPPGERLARTRAVTAPLKSAEHKALLRAVLTHLPRWLFARLVAVSTAPRRLTVCVSYFVMRRRLHYGDAVVHGIDGVICCPPGVPLAVVVLAYEDVVSACFRIDTALPGAESLPTRWRQAVADLAGSAS
ncbi:wax ester/triacylglycerol synthase domain-containing protein [Streptomyces sp. NPDC002888]|uniref:wax ester/triacylglycerol synthase domain-containing protein n=1 Tax=Streptomyces sp. NPDC002888 TaxID=3364668 RepID=UPI0036764C35